MPHKSGRAARALGKNRPAKRLHRAHVMIVEITVARRAVQAANCKTARHQAGACSLIVSKMTRHQNNRLTFCTRGKQGGHAWTCRVNLGHPPHEFFGRIIFDQRSSCVISHLVCDHHASRNWHLGPYQAQIIQGTPFISNEWRNHAPHDSPKKPHTQWVRQCQCQPY